MIICLPDKRYNIPIISFLLLLFFSARIYAAPPGPGGEPVKASPRKVGNRLYFTPACPIIAETFNQAADVNGATSDPSSVGWYLDASKVPNAVYFSIKSHRIKAQTLGGEGVWYSQVFNISGYTGIQVDAKISSEGSFTSSEYVKVSYILDGGPETLIGTYTGAFGTPLVTSAQMTGSKVQIVIRLYNVSAGNNDYYIEQYDVYKETGPCTVSPISVSASASNSGVLTCTNPSTTLTASTTATGTTTYSWTGPNSFSATGASVTATTAGTYTVTGTNSAGTGTATVNVTSNTAAPGGLTATASGSLSCAVSGVTLTASSTESDATFSWTGPNSYSNTGATVTANMAGTYTLTAKNPTTGCTASTTVAVTSNTTNPTNVTATASGPLTCSTPSVTLTGSSSLSGVTFAWTGPNSYTATGATATATAAGTYTLTATYPPTGCWSSVTVPVTSNITAPAGVTATASGSLSCTNTSVTLTGSSTTSGTTFTWSGPNSFTASGATATVTAPGTYTVTATNPSTGCTATATTTVTQNLTAPSNVTATNNGPLTCNVTSVTMNASSTTTSGVTYAWTGPNSYTATGATATATAPGTYTLTTTYTPTGCTATATTTVVQNVSAPASVTATASGSLSCSNTSVTLTGSSTTSGTTFTWSGPNSFTATGATATATAAGTYTLTATNPASGCTATTTVTVTGNTAAPAGVAIAAANNVTQLTCSTNFTTLSGSSTTSGVTYSWSGPNSFTATSSAVNVFNPGTYTLTVTNPTDGCTSTASIAITQNVTSPAGVAISPNVAALTCTSPSVTLTGSSTTSGVNYSWSGPSSFTATGNTATAVTAGQYILTVTNPTNGCTSTTTATVSQNFTPPAGVTAINSGPITCLNPNVTLTGASTTTGTTFAWTGPNGFTATGATAGITLGQGGTYTLRATNPANGCTATTTTVVAEDDLAPTNVVVSSNTSSPVITCINPTLTLTASSSTPNLNYAWRIGVVGNTIATGATLSVSQANQYNVLATNPVNGCATLAGLVVTQNTTTPASLALNITPATGVLTCSNTTVSVTGTSSDNNVTYAWTGPNGFTASSASASVTTPGTYTLTATDNTSGCSSTISTPVTQDVSVPQGLAIATNTGSTVINCFNPTLTLTGSSTTSGTGFGWTSGNTTTTGNPLKVTTPGTYTLVAVNNSNGCTSSLSTAITIDTATPAAITTSSVPANALLTCSTPNVVLTGSSSTSGVTYAWTGPNSYSSSGAVATVTTPGSYVVTVTNPHNGCSSAAAASAVTQNIVVPVGVTANASNTLSCLNPNVTITGNSTTTGATYTWAGPGGFTSSARVATATVGGPYTLTVTNPANGCTTTKNLTVIADTASPAGVTATNSGPLTCDVTTVTLTGNSTTSNVSYIWSGPNGFFDPEQISTAATDSGLYVLTVSSNTNGCFTTASTYVSQDLSACTTSSVVRTLTNGKASVFSAGATDSLTTAPFTYKVYPNPVSTVAYIEFNSATRSQVSVELYNAVGVREQVLFQSAVEANQRYQLTLHPGGLGAGIHYCVIHVDNKVYTSKLLLTP